jgi:hypothetical protein
MTTRQERLNSLKDAVVEWADREVERYEKQVDFLTSVLEGRTGSGQASQHIVDRASALTEEEINAFLEES